MLFGFCPSEAQERRQGLAQGPNHNGKNRQGMIDG